jgi:hypothetical protein
MPDQPYVEASREELDAFIAAYPQRTGHRLIRSINPMADTITYREPTGGNIAYTELLSAYGDPDRHYIRRDPAHKYTPSAPPETLTPGNPDTTPAQ